VTGGWEEERDFKIPRSTFRASRDLLPAGIAVVMPARGGAAVDAAFVLGGEAEHSARRFRARRAKRRTLLG
jgi:hypothetical protein